MFYRNFLVSKKVIITPCFLSAGYTVKVKEEDAQAGQEGRAAVCAGNAAGFNLQTIRKRRGLTQKELAEKTGITRESIAAYEAGRAHILDAALIDLSSALKVSADEILGIEKTVAAGIVVNRRWAKRLHIVEGLPESVRKHILRALDDLIRANTSLTIFDDTAD